MTRKLQRWWRACGSLTGALWVVSAAGWIGLLVTGRLVDLLRITVLLAGMAGCTRIAIARQRRTSESVTASLRQFQKADESLANRVIEDAVLRLAAAGELIVTAELRPAPSVNDRRLWHPDAYYGGTVDKNPKFTNVVPIRQRPRAS